MLGDVKHRDTTQLTIPGMPPRLKPRANASPGNVSLGQQILYLGHVNGGPRYGARGIVKRILGRTAIVDMGRVGTWHIPYFLLRDPLQGS